MADINVFGSALGQVAPDLGVLTVSVGTQSYASAEDARAAFATALNDVRHILAPAPGAGNTYHERRAASSTWRDTDTGSDRYAMSATISAKYPVGGAALKRAIDELSALTNVSFATSWETSPALSKESRDELLAEAVIDAKRQAAAIAKAAGQKIVSLKVVAEPELFPGKSNGDTDAGLLRGAARSAAFAVGGAAEVDVELTPEPVDISVRIAVSYHAE